MEQKLMTHSSLWRWLVQAVEVHLPGQWHNGFRNCKHLCGPAAADVETGAAGVGAGSGGGAAAGPLAVTKIYAAGICCPMEVPLVEKLLSPLPGVAKVNQREALCCAKLCQNICVQSALLRVLRNPGQCLLFKNAPPHVTAVGLPLWHGSQTAPQSLRNQTPKSCRNHVFLF